MLIFLYQVSLVLVAIQNEALTQQHDGHGLYVDYHGEYAGAYDNYKPRPYAFEYGVSDPHTGDHKTHWEMKDETGVVRGSYSLLESDGSTRTVDYVADHSGFRAVVKKIGSHGKVYSIQNHGSVPSNSAVHTSLHETEVDILQQHLIPENLPFENVPLYQSYNGEFKNYEKYTSEVPHQLTLSGSYDLKNPAENTYHETGTNVDEIHAPEQSGVGQNIFSGSYNLENPAENTYHETGSNSDEIHAPEQSGVRQNSFSEQQLIFNSKEGNSFNEQPQYLIVLPETVDTHQQQSTYEAKSSNTESLQYPTDINIPVTIYSENAYQNDNQVDEIHRNSLERMWESQSAYDNQLGRHPYISLNSRSHESNFVSHPHGESSQRFYSQTGNNHDDTQYND